MKAKNWAARQPSRSSILRHMNRTASLWVSSSLSSHAPKLCQHISYPAFAQWMSALQIIYYLSGLTCTDENVITKCGIQRKAAERGVAIIAPDTSPRGLNV